MNLILARIPNLPLALANDLLPRGRISPNSILKVERVFVLSVIGSYPRF